MGSRIALPLFLVAEGTSLFGNSAIAIVLPWLILERTHDPAAAGFVAMLTGVPAVIAALIGGHLIDRVGRKHMAVFADCGSAVSVAALAAVDQLVGLNLSWFIGLGLLGALFDVPGMTARETLMADVSEESGVALDKVAGLRQTIFGVSFLAGPALAGVLMAVLDPIRVVWLTAACSAIAALTTGLLPLLRKPVAEDEADEKSPLAGWAVVRRNPGLVGILIISFASTVPVAPLLAVVLPAHFQAMNAPALLGVANSAYAVGYIIGSGCYAAGLSRWRWPSWVASIVLFTGSFVLIGTLRGFWLVAAGMALAGIGSGLMGPIYAVGMTENVPDRQRGRVFGLLNALALVAAPVGLGLMTVLLSVWSLQTSAWALLGVWVPAAIYAIMAPGLKEFVEPKEVPVVDHRPVG